MRHVGAGDIQLSWSQSEDYAAKVSIIDGIRAFEAGEDRADSLLSWESAIRSRRSRLNAGRSLLEKSEAGQEARQAFQRAIDQHQISN